MIENVLTYLQYGGTAITLFAVAMIVGGFLLAAGRLFADDRKLGPQPVKSRKCPMLSHMG